MSYAPGAYDGALKDGARVASSNGAAGDGPGRTNVMAVPSAENLGRLGALLDEGGLRVHIHDTFPLDRATTPSRRSRRSTSAASSQSAPADAATKGRADSTD